VIQIKGEFLEDQEMPDPNSTTPSNADSNKQKKYGPKLQIFTGKQPKGVKPIISKR
tara:strand:+ start:205 stop:372 length:168 start_codon:yes stop_codon:yes gene_type:complete